MKSVAVIGGGPAGLAISSFLAKNEYEVTVFEKVKNPGPVGAGIMLQRSGLNVLNNLDLLDDFLELGEEINTFRGYNKNGKRVLSLNLSEKDPNDYGLGIQRGALFNALHTKALSLEIKFRYSTNIVEVTGGVGNKILYDDTGSEFGPYDIVIVANGARSNLRKKYKVTKVDKPQKWGAVWSLLDVVGDQYNNSIIHNYKGTKQMLGFMAVGKLEVNQPKRINFFWSLKMSQKNEWLNLDELEWKRQILNLAPEHEEIIGQLKKTECIVAPYHDAFVSPMYEDGVFFIGDAAHAMSPQLSAGTNLSLLDAWLLSKEFETTNDLNRIASNFYRLRKHQLNYYYRVSKLVTPMFQSDYNLAWVRNNLLGGLIKTPGPKQIFRETLLGRRKSLFTNVIKDWVI